MTSLAFLTLLVVVIGVVNRRGYARALALAGATPVGAAAVVGAVAVPTFYAVAAGAAVGLGLRLLQQTRSPEGPTTAVPASRSLVLLVVVGVLATLVAPLLFNGLLVLSPGGSSPLAAGVLTKSNLAQIIYLVLSVAVVFFLARARWAGPEVVGTAACLATLLSLWAWSGTFGVPFPVGLFDNSPAFTFQDMLPGGAPRVRGIFSEPAGLANSSLVTLAYGAARLRSVSGLRRVGLIAVMAIAGYLGAISTSATFFVGGAALGIVAVLVAASSLLFGRGSLSRVAATSLCAVAISSVWILPLLTNTLAQVISDKVVSSSYSDRSAADWYSYGLVWDTLGFGVGLGSNRASSFAATLLSTVGIVGTLLLAVVIWVLVRDAWPVRTVRPVVWALAALLIAKLISGPDLADTSGILWMGLGVLAHAALKARSPRLDTIPVNPDGVSPGPDPARGPGVAALGR